MPAPNYLPDVLETTEAERLATGFIFTEGPLWHPEGYWYFVDIRQNKLFRITPGKLAEVVRTTIGGNGTTFDLEGRLIVCEGDDRRVTRMGADGKVESLVDSYKGGRFNRPNDVICHSNGWRIDRAGALRIPERARALAGRAHDVRGEHALVEIHPRDQARCRWQHGRAEHLRRHERRRRAPDGLKVDSIGRVYCTGPGGIWVMTQDGKRVGIIKWPEQAVNFAFGGLDLRTLLCCAHASVYTLRVKVPGNPHPWYRLRAR